MEYFWYSETYNTNEAKIVNFNNLQNAKKELQIIANNINEIIYLSYYLQNGIEKRLNIVPFSAPKRLKTINFTI